ncbi:MAG: TPM domain-containing protein [Candidatus Andeanibacterium colombiense]|uniref:TPM domain-containing protein n=1 Tax=Candidatus Andeanibacterium colombiense TaxID=3121345 RepID=A0AAJ5X8K6_9SPHN|nr:MAG: TPM domain-containing protein [Sphingomonadaceae bacterium]
MLRLRDHALALVNCLLAAMLLAGIAAPANAALPPRPDKAVYDGANIIPDADEAALDQQLGAYVAKTGNAVIVATVPSLDGDTIETYAPKLYETWGIGSKERDTGVLLLVAPNERKVRIEVGYGLTPYITDILSGRIIANDITPRFKQGDYAGGIDAGVSAIVTQLNRTPADAKAIADAAAASQKARHEANGPTVFGVIFWIVMIVAFVGFFARRNGGRRYGGGGIGSAVGNIVLWEALNAATRGGGGSSWGGGGGGFGGGGGGFGGFGGGMSGGGGASGSW